jgi:hypothetical protein
VIGRAVTVGDCRSRQALSGWRLLGRRLDSFSQTRSGSAQGAGGPGDRLKLSPLLPPEIEGDSAFGFSPAGVIVVGSERQAGGRSRGQCRAGFRGGVAP